jgi:alginate O-acetyltransferase complex protein AlgI
MRRGTLAAHGPVDFFGYMFLVPIFTAGPIERFDHFLANRAARWEASHLAQGGTRILHGLIKKFVLAALVVQLLRQLNLDDAVAVAADPHAFGPLQVWSMLGLFAVNVYLDFSAYSDIAIGAARLFGVTIMENFDFPFLATNLGDFWRRWHMTLVGFCQAYVYMPVLGWTRNPYLATIVSFSVIGLWHAGSWHWLLWGLHNAVGVMAARALGRRRRGRSGPPAGTLRALGGRAIGRIVTLGYFALGVAFTATYPRGELLDAFRLIGRALLLPPGLWS